MNLDTQEKCPKCGNNIAKRNVRKHAAKCGKRKRPKQAALPKDDDMEPDWTRVCENCGASPVVPITGMCGPCSFGEASTAGGNW